MRRKTAGSDPTVAEILERKKASIKDAPLPKGSPSWEDLSEERMSEIDTGYKTIRKLLSDRRFDK